MEIALVLIIVGGAVWLFATERFPIDLVAMMVLGALLLVGLLAYQGWIDADKWVTPAEGISGFSNTAVITVAAMFVLSAGLEKTGAVRLVSRWLTRLGKSPTLLLMAVMVTAGTVSAFINNTATVAIFLPLVLAVAARRQISPSKLLIPLSYASQFGGVCTLIGTSTNLLVSSIADQAGVGAFGMFEMGRMGIILVGAGITYFVLIGRWLLPARRGAELTETYQLGEYITEVRVTDQSPLIGRTIVESQLGSKLDVTVLELLRDKQRTFSPLHQPLRAGDVLLVRGKVDSLMDLRANQGLQIEPEFKLRDEELAAGDLTLTEAVVATRAEVAGKTLAELEFRTRYRAIVLAIQRRGHTLRDKLNTVRLRFGDALLLMARKEDIARLRAVDSFIVLGHVDEPMLRRHKVPVALAIFLMVVTLAAFGVMPIVVSAILGCVALVVTRCITLEEAYQAIEWKVIFLLAGVLPLGLTLEKTGLATLAADGAVQLVGQLGPLAVLAMLYLVTAVLTEFISNNAAAVLLAPVAISMAQGMAVSPRPFLMAVTFAASTAFATPVGYQTNAMIYNPGGYRFTDYMKTGIPLVLIFWALSVFFIPRFWPF